MTKKGHRGRAYILSRTKDYMFKVLPHPTFGMVEIRFTTKKVYRHPDEAPNYARLRRYRAMWRGLIELSYFAACEVDALKGMREMLTSAGFGEYTPLVSGIEQREAAA